MNRTKPLAAALIPLALAIALAGIATPVAATTSVGNITIHDFGGQPIALLVQPPLGWSCDHQTGDTLPEPLVGGVAVSCHGEGQCTHVEVAGYGLTAGLLKASSACVGLDASVNILLPMAGANSNSGRGSSPWVCAADDTLVAEAGEDWWIHCTVTVDL